MPKASITPKGLALGLALGAAAAALVVASGTESLRQRAWREAHERRATVELSALAQVIERAGEQGAARAAAASWLGSSGELARVRWVDLNQRTLEVSTWPQDTATGALPRSLVREEKPLFDLAQELRSAVEVNREEGKPREAEVILRWLERSRLEISLPVLRDGAVVGLLQAETAKLPARPGLGWVDLLLDFAKPLAPLLLLVAIAARRRRFERLAWGIFLFGVPLLGLSLWLADERSRSQLAAGRAAEATSLAAHLGATTERATTALGSAGIDDATLVPAAWDVDRFRRPRNVLGADGKPDPAATTRAEAASAERVHRRTTWAGVLGLLLYGLVGLGAVATAWKTFRKFRVAYAYATPALLGMLVLVFFPFLYGVALSFTNSNIYNTDQPLSELWVGFDNYTEILSDLHVRESATEGAATEGTGFNYRNFYWTLGFTVVWTVSNVSIGLSVGLALALMLNTKKLRGRSVYRVLLILPWAVPNYITSLIWKGMFHQQFGIINQVIQIFGGAPISWFERPGTSFATVLATNGWLSFPFMMVIALGALQSIPADLYEAARVDGASRWQQFRRITLPLLKPALVPAVIISVIWTFNMFNIIYLVSEGQPAGATEILITHAYKLAFEQYRYGYAAAYSMVIFIILFAYGTWQNRVTQASEGV